MCRARIENERKVGPQHRAQIVHVAGLADACFHNPEIFIAVCIQDGPGHADLIIVVQGVARSFARQGQYPGQSFLDGCLARRAGHAHNAGLGAVAPQRGQTAQRPDSVGHDKNRHGYMGQRTRGQHGSGPLLYRPGGEIVPVHPAAGNTDKEGTRHNRPAVSGDRSQGNMLIGP